MIVIVWMFYDENEIGQGYNIQSQDFIYYLIFIIVFIPFFSVIEIMFLNISEYYNGCSIHDYADFLRTRYCHSLYF